MFRVAVVAGLVLALSAPAAQAQYSLTASVDLSLGGDASAACPLKERPFEIEDCSGFRFVTVSAAANCTAPKGEHRGGSWILRRGGGNFEQTIFHQDGSTAPAEIESDLDRDPFPLSMSETLVAKPGHFYEAELSAKCAYSPPDVPEWQESKTADSAKVLVPPAIRLGSSVPLMGGSTVQDGRLNAHRAPNLNLRRLRRGRKYHVWYQPYADVDLVRQDRLRVRASGAGVRLNRVVPYKALNESGLYLTVRPTRAGTLRIWLSLDGARSPDEIRLKIRR